MTGMLVKMRLEKVSPLLSGILYMLLASLFFAAMGAFVKAASRTIPFFEVAFFRSLISFLILFFLVKLKGIPVKATNWRGLIIRSVSGCAAFVCYFFAISRIHLADAVLLNYTSPFFTVLLAAPLLKEKIDKKILLCLGVAFSGVILVLKPSGSFLNLGGLLGLLSGFLAAIAYIQVKQLSRTENSWTIVFYFTLLSTFLTLPLLFFNSVLPDLNSALLLLGVGASGAIAQVLMTAAYRRIPASIGSVISLATVVLAALLGILFFKEHPDLLDYVGGLLILGSGVYLTLNKKS
ncbi:MAG TPA: EamA family transporter [Cyanobacteria bacterium UBA8530]|nr:EamA family transporter [Cyanobacteria bacterium UBA8530]